jgi:hypothetical protein
MGRTQLSPYYQDYISPIFGVIKWQLFTKLILELSHYEIGIDDIIMYLPATVSLIDTVLHNKSNQKFAVHSILTFVHNMRGHRFLPYIDPKTGYHCNLSPMEDVVHHAFMLIFVDYAVSNKFPSESLNTLYKHFSTLMKLGFAYSLYVSYYVVSDPDACLNFIPSLAIAPVPIGTMFSLLTMWNFPFDNADKYSKNQLIAYTGIMYLASISAGLALAYEYYRGSTFEDLYAGKFFESYFIAGASLKGLEIISDFLKEKMANLINLIKDPKGLIEQCSGSVKNIFSSIIKKVGVFKESPKVEVILQESFLKSSEHKYNGVTPHKR